MHARNVNARNIVNRLFYLQMNAQIFFQQLQLA